jgi:uncharacterized protein (TIGR04222 family)
MDGQRRTWVVDGLELDVYDIAVLGRDRTLAPAVAAAELYQAGVIATDRHRLVRAGPLPPGVHPVEQAVYEVIPDGPPGRGEHSTDPTGHIMLQEARDAPAVWAVRRRVGAEYGLARPDADRRFRDLSGLAGGSAAMVAGVAACIWAVAKDGWWGVIGGITLAPYAVLVGLALGWLPYGMLGRLVRMTPRGRQALRELRAQGRAELRTFHRGSRGGGVQTGPTLSLGAAIALTGSQYELHHWNEELDTALSPLRAATERGWVRCCPRPGRPRAGRPRRRSSLAGGPALAAGPGVRMDAEQPPVLAVRVGGVEHPEDVQLAGGAPSPARSVPTVATARSRLERTS